MPCSVTLAVVGQYQSESQNVVCRGEQSACFQEATIAIAVRFGPDTIQRWHRQLVANNWDCSDRKTKRQGRPMIRQVIIDVTVKFAKENPTWGYDRISGALSSVGYVENLFGEQWVLPRGRSPGVAILRGGHIGWNTQFDVTNGYTGKLILNPSEARWLASCLAASQSFATR